MIDELDVSLSGAQVGILRRTRRGARFAYDPAVVQELTGAPLLSCSLPVKARPYSEGLTGAWFEGLLPEGERRTRLCRRFDCAEHDYASLLAHVGWECAGAVSVTPRGFVPPEDEGPRTLTECELAELLSNLPFADIQGLAAQRVSLGGYQEKAVLVSQGVEVHQGFVSSCTFALPDASSVSTHILKPQPASRLEGLVEAEAWAMAAASRAARCAECAVLNIDGAPQTLVVRRFDRIATSDGPMRVHQEDGCQAMGIHPGGKYANDKGEKGDDPALAKIAALLFHYSLDPLEELAELLRQTTVNLALGNVDAHAKNLALMYEKPCSPTLSPMYDVVPVADMLSGAQTLSMRVNGKIRLADVRREDLVGEAKAWGLGEGAAESVIDEAMGRLAAGIEYASRLYPEAAARFAACAEARMRVLAG